MRQATIGPGGAVISETVVFQDIGSGFFATPRVNGERVTIDISQRADSVGASARRRRQHAAPVNDESPVVSASGSSWAAPAVRSAVIRPVVSDFRPAAGRMLRSIWLMVEEVQ